MHNRSTSLTLMVALFITPQTYAVQYEKTALTGLIQVLVFNKLDLKWMF